MDGPRLFKLVAHHIVPFFEETLKKAMLELKDIDHVIPHQASQSALELVRRRLTIEQSKFHNLILERGNCVSASIPMVLHHLIETRQLHKGQKVMLLGTGAGVSLGSIVFSY
jgi:3-oxoacyl-[acyl-carrier-protein] synthase-3